jgi:hypothetical protein
MQKDMEAKTAMLMEEQQLRERYGDQYQNLNETIHKFAYQAIDGMNEQYATDIINGKTTGQIKPMTTRIGPGGIEAFNIREVKNVQELEQFGPETLANVDLDEIIPDAPEFKEDRYWEEEIPSGEGEAYKDPRTHAGWIPTYKKKFEEDGEAKADEYIEERFHQKLSSGDTAMNPEWQRERIKSVYMYHPELKDKKQEDIDKLTDEQVKQYIPKAEARRIKAIHEKRQWKERQAVARETRRKEQDAQAKGMQTRSLVADATAKNIAKFTAEQQPGFLDKAGSVLGGLGKFAMVAAPAAIQGYVDYKTAKSKILLEDLKAHAATLTVAQQEQLKTLTDSGIEYASSPVGLYTMGGTLASALTGAKFGAALGPWGILGGGLIGGGVGRLATKVCRILQ